MACVVYGIVRLLTFTLLVVRIDGPTGDSEQTWLTCLSELSECQVDT